MYFSWIWEQTAIISLYGINWLVFITEMERVYFALRASSLYKTDQVSLRSPVIKLAYTNVFNMKIFVLQAEGQPLSAAKGKRKLKYVVGI